MKILGCLSYFIRLFTALLMIAMYIVISVGALALAHEDGTLTNEKISIVAGTGLLVLFVAWAMTRSKSNPSKPISTNQMVVDEERWRSDPATDKQKKFANNLKIKYWQGITKGELSDLIDLKLDERNQ